MSNEISFTRGQGALGRPLPNRDHVSALAFPADTLPAGFSTTDRCKKVFSLEAAELLGITSTSADVDVKTAHYHISEFYRLNPKGELYIYLYAPATALNAVLTAVVNFPDNGEIRQIGILGEFEPQDGDDAIVPLNITAPVSAAQVVANAALAAHKPVSIFLATKEFTDTIDFTDLPDLRALACPNVSFVLGCSGSGVGSGFNGGAIGSVLGAVSKSAVHESLAWVEKFNFSDGTELETLALGNVEVLVTPTIDLGDLADKGYLVFKKHIGVAGSYLAESCTCDLATSDYSMIENERTIDKSQRNVRAKMLPNLARPIYVNADGTIREDSVAYFSATTAEPLEAMKRDGEISDYVVTINPDQNILTTSTLQIGYSLQPVGVARMINFKIGFTVKITQ